MKITGYVLFVCICQQHKFSKTIISITLSIFMRLLKNDNCYGNVTLYVLYLLTTTVTRCLTVNFQEKNAVKPAYQQNYLQRVFLLKKSKRRVYCYSVSSHNYILRCVKL